MLAYGHCSSPHRKGARRERQRFALTWPSTDTHCTFVLFYFNHIIYHELYSTCRKYTFLFFLFLFLFLSMLSRNIFFFIYFHMFFFQRRGSKLISFGSGRKTLLPRILILFEYKNKKQKSHIYNTFI